MEFSAFVEDMRMDALPKAVRADIARFVEAKDHHQFPHYGMVVKELLTKADPNNLKSARAHVRKGDAKMSMKLVQMAIRRGDKFILLMNDRIVDGHHFLAKAEHGGVTSSLDVLDLTPARFQFSMKQDRTGLPPKSKQSKLRTAAVVAGGAGVGYGGYRVGRAALATQRAVEGVAPHLAGAAEKLHGVAADARAASGAVRAPFTKLRRLFRLGVLTRKDEVTLSTPLAFAFAGETVAQNRYKKAIREHESDRAESNYAKSAVAGGALGALLRKPGMPRGHAALVGAGAGLATQAAVRAITAPTKDKFGDRPLEAKRAERVPWQAGAVGAGVVGYRKLARKLVGAKRTVGLQARSRVLNFDLATAAGDVARWAGPAATALRKKLGQAGSALGQGLHAAEGAPTWAKAVGLGGGIAAADSLSSAALPNAGESRTDAAGKGLVRGALYGGALVAAEPLITNVVKKLRTVAASARFRLIAFGGEQQARANKGRFVDPLAAADLPVAHGQVIRAALNKGRDLHRSARRAGNLVGDVTNTLAGRAKTDARGRPQKREWEKTWFKNAAGSAAAAGALLAHKRLLVKSPAYRARVGGIVGKAKHAANAMVPDLFPMSARLRLLAFRAKGGRIKSKSKSTITMGTPVAAIAFDGTAASWDVRDQRGRSARVFAPGAGKRERRQKEWYEKSDNQRKIAGALAVAAGVGGALLGHNIGVARGVKKAGTERAAKGWGTRRAAASENAAIERMKRKPPGGQAVS